MGNIRQSGPRAKDSNSDVRLGGLFKDEEVPKKRRPSGAGDWSGDDDQAPSKEHARSRIKLADGTGILAAVYGSLAVKDDTVYHVSTGTRLTTYAHAPKALAQHLNATVDWSELDQAAFGMQASKLLHERWHPVVTAGMRAFKPPKKAEPA